MTKIEETQKRFYNIITTIIVIASIIIAGLAYIAENQGLEIRSYSGLNSNFIPNTSPSIKIEFNSPIDQAVRKLNIVKTDIDLQYDLIVQGRQLTINFKGALPEEMASLNIEIENIFDIYGRTMDSSEILNFPVIKPQLLYIERVKGRDKEKIVQVKFENEIKTKKVFEANKILDYDSNGQYTAVVAREEDLSSRIHILDSEFKEIYSVNFGTNVREIAMFDNSSEFLVVDFEFEIFGDRPINSTQQNSKIKLFNIVSKDYNEIKLSERVEMSDIHISKNDNIILFLNELDGNYYVANILDSETLISLGRQLQSSGFGHINNNLIFSTFDLANRSQEAPDLMIYSDGETYSISNERNIRIDPTPFFSDDEFLISQRYKEIVGSRGLYEIVKFNGEIFTNLYRIEGLSAEYSTLSPNGKLASVELYNSEQLIDFDNQRQSSYQTKPLYSDLVIINSLTGEEITKISNGNNVRWIF